MAMAMVDRHGHKAMVRRHSHMAMVYRQKWFLFFICGLRETTTMSPAATLRPVNGGDVNINHDTTLLCFELSTPYKNLYMWVYMLIYGYIWLYTVIYILKYVFWMSGLVLWMSGLVFLVSGLVFFVSGLVFGCLD